VLVIESMAIIALLGASIAGFQRLLWLVVAAAYLAWLLVRKCRRLSSLVRSDIMEPSTALTTSAQIAIAIAGFAGVVAVFRTGSVHDWGQVERFWLRLLLVNSILPLAFSMVGLLLLAVTPVPPAIWRWCSGFATLSLFLYATVILRQLLRFAPGQLEAAGATKFSSYSLFALLTIVCLLQLCNVARLAAFWPFFGAIVALLLGAMYQFVRLVLSPQHPH
jgi:hypothetical protein